jgi:predicted NBD/HSP70 family sugar kinase
LSSPLLASIDRVHEGAPHRVKDEEKALLYREICVGRNATRQGLARRLDIRPSSVSEAVQELVDDGLVRELPAHPKGAAHPRGAAARPKGRTGRPQLILSPQAARFVAISAYVDSRELKGVLVTQQEEVLAEEVRVLPAEAGNREIRAAIIDLVKSLRTRVPEGSEMAGAGLSLAGSVNERTRTWAAVARWPKLADLDLSDVEARLDFPIILRRANEAELEYYLDSTPRARAGTTLLLHWGFGIGAAAAFHGRLLTSSLGRFGEIGHARIGTDGSAPCICGQRGCLESAAALWALRPVLAQAFGALPEDERDLAPLLGSARLLQLPELKGALNAVQEALAVLSMIFFPDTILLTGPFTENPNVLRRLAAGFRRSLPAYAKEAVTVTAIPGGMNGTRRGGANPLFREALARALRRKT